MMKLSKLCRSQRLVQKTACVPIFTADAIIHRNFHNCSHRSTPVVESFKKLLVEHNVALPLEDKDLLGSILQTQGSFTEGNRLKFIGKNVASLCVADYLFAHFPNFTSDHLSMVTTEFLKKRTIVEVAKSLKLDTLLKNTVQNAPSNQKAFSESEADIENDFSEKPNAPSMNIERNNLDMLLVFAVLRMIGAIYEHHGMTEARKFVVKHIITQSVDITAMLQFFDPRLQLVQMVRTGEMHEHSHKVVEFKEVGKDDKRMITARVYVDDELIGEGVGQTRKIAEQKAAQDALNKWFSFYYSAQTPLQKFD